MQKHVNLVDLVKSFPTHIFLQNLASIQKRTNPIKFAHLAGKSEIAVRYRTFQLSGARGEEEPRGRLTALHLSILCWGEDTLSAKASRERKHGTHRRFKARVQILLLG